MAGLTYHRKNIPPEFADTSQWPACDTDGWSQEEQERYTTYHSAICDYLQFKSLSKLKKEGSSWKSVGEFRSESPGNPSMARVSGD